MSGPPILAFSSLHPGRGLAAHGAFVAERCVRLAAALDAELAWMQPVPWPPRPGRSVPARLARLPREETTATGYRVLRPRYLHLPGWGVHAHAARMALGARAAFRAAVRARRPALVDAHFLYPDAVAALRLCAGERIPCVVTARGSDVDVLAGIPAVRAELRAWLPEAAAVLAVSPPLAEALRALVPGLEVGVAPNGVDPARFRRTAAPRAERLVAVGRLVPDKGATILVEALASEPGRALPPLHWIGDGPLRDRVLARARKLGIAERVVLRGALPPAEVARDLHEQGGIFVHPSRHEGWPNALMEALCCGLPVVATAVGGIPALLGPGDHGRLVPVDAVPRAWAEAIAEVRARRDRDPEGLADRARARGEALAWERRIPELAALYAEILSGAVGPRP